MAHNRYWSASTPYAQQNGGAWPFELDRRSGFAVPLGRGFWEHLFARARRRGWNLVTYEQDWMNFRTPICGSSPRPAEPRLLRHPHTPG